MSIPRLFIVVVIAAIALLLPVLVLLSERATLRTAEAAVAMLTPYRLVLVAPELRPLEGTLRASELHLYPAADDGPPFLSLLDLRARFTSLGLARFWRANGELSASQLTLYVSELDSTSDPSPGDWLQQLRWLPSDVQLGQLHVVSVGPATRILRLQEIRGQQDEAGAFNLAAASDYGGEPFTLALNLDRPTLADGAAQVNVSAELKAQASASQLKLQGVVTGSASAVGYHFDLQADYRQVERLLDGFTTAPTLAGHLQLSGALVGNADGFDLTNTRLILDNMPDYGIEAYGEVHYDRLSGGVLDLQASGELAAMPEHFALPGLNLDNAGVLRAAATITGNWTQPDISELLLRTENDAGLSLTLRGRLSADLTRFSDNQVQVDLVGPSLASLAPWTGPLPIEAGPFASSGRLVGSEDGIALEDLVIEMGRPGEALLRVAGRADDVSGVVALGPDAIQGLSLHMTLQSPDSQRLGALLNLPLPPGFDVDGELALAGTSRLLQPAAGSLRLASSDIEIELTPQSAMIRPFAAVPLSGLRASARLFISDTSALSQFLDLPVPALGEVRGEALLAQIGSTLALREIDAALTGESAQLRVQGGIPDLMTFAGTRLAARYRDIEVSTLLLTAVQDLQYDAPLGSLQGSMEFHHSSDTWNLSRFTLQTEPAGAAVNLHASGEVADLAGHPRADVQLRYAINDTALLEALLGLRVKPVSGNLDVQSAAGSLQLTGLSRIGRTRLQAGADVTWLNDQLSVLQVTLSSDLVHLDDLGLQAGEVAGYRPAAQLDQSEVEALLQRLLTIPPQLQTDIALRAAGLRGANTEINSLDVHTTGENNRYTVRRLNVGYGDSLTELRGIIDLNATPPFVSVAGQGPRIPLHTLGKDLGLRSEVGGRLTLLGGISTRGTTIRELLAESQGSLALALEDATFEGAAYDLLATDLLGWVFSGASRERLTRIDCSMARFTLQKGVASTDNLYMETPQMVATGSGRLDLMHSELDMELTPRSRTRTLQVPSRVRLTGRLEEPRVSVSPVAAAADASAELISLVPKLARKIFGISDRASEAQPCEAGGRADTLQR